MAKREPLLADALLEVIARGEWYTKTQVTLDDTELKIRNNHVVRYRRLGEKILQAKKFVLDPSATKFLKHMTVYTPEAVVWAQDFAIQPHNPMWVEFDASFYNLGPDRKPVFSEDGREFTRTGFLFYDNRVVRASQEIDAEKGVIPAWSNFTYKMHTTDEPNAIETMLGKAYDGEVMDGLLWGPIGDAVFTDRSVLPELKKSNAIDNDSMKDAKFFYRSWDELIEDLKNSAGALRIGIAVLLLLNRTSPHQHIQEVKAGQRVVQGKVTPMVKHSVLSLKLNPDPKTIFHMPGDGVWRRQHDVRGHFCTNKRAKTSFCNGLHDWQEIKPHIWQCDRCKGLKWWRKEHKRGNADKGIVTQEYKVTAERKQS